ncbi:MAG: universal stress protein, partial [Chitinophagales bacterium]
MKRILIPIDFSELSEYAFSIAKEIQEKTNAQLIGLNVVHVGKSALYKTDGTLSDSNDFDVEAIRKQQADNEQKIQEFLKDVPNSKGVVKIGNIEEIIL